MMMDESGWYFASVKVYSVREELRCDGLLAGDSWYEDGAICEDEPAGFPEEVYPALEAALRTGGPG